MTDQKKARNNIVVLAPTTIKKPSVTTVILLDGNRAKAKQQPKPVPSLTKKTPPKTTNQQTPVVMSNGNLKAFLKDFVKQKVTLTGSDTSQKVQIFKDSIERCVIQEMRAADKLFNEIYQNVYYAGSYFDGLKIGQADEFDLNLRLRLPFNAADIEVVHAGIPPGFVKYKLKKNLETLLARHPKWEIYKDLSKLMDPDHIYLSQDKLNRWHNSVLDRAFDNMKAKFKYPLTRSKSGPAMTLRITVGNNDIIDVDLVPVIELADFPGSVRRPSYFNNLPSHKKTCFIVPKPCPSHLATLNEHEMFFRVSIPDAERHILDNKQALKMLVKIFKAIRDHEHWSFLASYFIKTVFMWHDEQHTDVSYWKEDRLDELFITMLQEFISAFNSKSIRHIYFHTYNLISQVDQATLANCKGRLETILKYAQTDPLKLYATYNVKRVGA